MRLHWAWSVLLGAGVVLGCGGDDGGSGGNTPPNVEDPNADDDGDGRTNLEETTGYTIQVDANGFGFDHPDFLETRAVTSDPKNPDTDGDGLDDGKEYLSKTDPRHADTDGDGLTDYDELGRWQSSPVSVDTDGDSNGPPDAPVAPNAKLFDGAELALVDDPAKAGRKVPGPTATSPLLEDTDGDGVSDYDERLNPLRKPTVAELPELDIQLYDPVDLRLRVTYAESSGTTNEYGSEYELSTSKELSKSDSSSLTNSTEHSQSISVGAEASWPPSVSVEVSATTTVGVETSVATEVSQTTAYGMTQAHSKFQGESKDKTIQTESGAISLSMIATNTGTIAYNLAGMGIVVRQYDAAEGRYRTLTLLQAPAGFDSFVLAPGEDSDIVPFEALDLDANVVKSLLANPSSLILEPVSFDLLGPDGTDFVFLTENTFSRTALVIVDYGDGKVDSLRVATNVDHDDAGELSGVPLANSLEAAGLDFETKPDAKGRQTLTRIGKYDLVRHDGTAPDLGDPAYPNGKAAGPRSPRKMWVTYGARPVGAGAMDMSVDFGAIRLHPRDEIRLVYVADEDRDGLFDREEFVHGSSDTNVQSDASSTEPNGDGLSDYYEVRVGWEVKLQGTGVKPPYMVYSSPILIDTDGDNLTDGQEQALGTDPGMPDTDGDGVTDDVDPTPLSAVNAPPVNNVSVAMTLKTAKLTGSVTDPENNLVSVDIDWGDGKTTTPPLASVGALDLTHVYTTVGKYDITITSTDFLGAKDIDKITVDALGMPGDYTLYKPYSLAAGDIGTECYQQTGSGLEPLTDRWNNVLSQCCFFLQNPGEPKFIDYGNLSLGASVTIAMWIRSPNGNGFAAGELDYPALVVDGSGKMGFKMRVGTTNYVALDPTSLSGVTSWIFYAGVLESKGANSELRLYRNGSLLTSSTVTISNFTHASQGCTFAVGGDNNSGSCNPQEGPIQASVDDLRVFKRALTDNEILALYQEPKP